VQQQKILKAAEEQRIDELTEYRKAKALELATFEATISDLKGFDRKEITKQPRKRIWIRSRLTGSIQLKKSLG